MTYIQRIDYRPSMEALAQEDQTHVVNHFDAYGEEMMMEGQPVPWKVIEEVEVVVAPHAMGLAGWIVKNLLQKGENRYHIGVYFGRQEAVFPNVTWDVAKYVLENIAYYTPQQVKYTGPENLVPLTEI